MKKKAIKFSGFALAVCLGIFLAVNNLCSNTVEAATTLTGTGNGLKGEYFGDINLGSLLLTRIDKTISYNWGKNSPGTAIGIDNFSARWTGQVQPRYSEIYTFYIASDDGTRLWVNNTQIINDWTGHALKEKSGKLLLTAGQKYEIRLEYFEKTGNAAVKMSWSSAKQKKEIIPQSQLYSTLVAAVAPTTPTPGTTSASYWGMYYDGVPWDMNKLVALETAINKNVSIIHWGQPWWHNGQYQPFYPNEFESVRLHGAIPMINWSSWDFSNGNNQPDFTLANIYNGKHDAYITQWATAAKAWGHPFFLRLNQDMNGQWGVHWSELSNSNQPGDFVKAWKHVHDIFTAIGATNVTWVWCPTIVDTAKDTAVVPLATLYPGDNYVDWLGIDGYNWSIDNGADWKPFPVIFRQTYNELVQLSPEKPIMIGETSSSENGGSKAAWITDTLKTRLPLDFPKIRALVWFNWNENTSNLFWTIESSQASIDSFSSAIASDYYVSNQYLDLPPGPVAPPVR